MKKVILILGFLVLTNCAYKPKINPEASLHPHTGVNLASKYYYYLATCEDMWKHNLNWSPIAREGAFTRKCMKDFGFKLLYWK